MTEACGTCRAYTPTTGKDHMPGFGNCRHLPTWQYRSEWPWGCAFTPSRYEPKEQREVLELK